MNCQTYNIYCDESCYLENDGQIAMVLGAVWCPLESSRECAERIRELKTRHSLKRDFEIKWTKVSPSKEQFYIDLVNYFFDNSDLSFRALVVPDKSIIAHQRFNQDHDTWYYKMYFEMLRIIWSSGNSYRIYLDIKDTRSAGKVKKLHEVLCNDRYDFDKRIIARVQNVRSHEIELLQVADLLIGALSHLHRHLSGSNAKAHIIDLIRKRSGLSLLKTTLLRETKFNLLVWRSSGSNDV